MMDKPLSLAIKASGGIKAMSRKLGISHQAIGQWERMPPLRVLAVEAASGVDRTILRPDLYPVAKEVA